MNDNIPQEWSFKPPKKCSKSPVKLFAQRNPYNGLRVNTAVLSFPYIPSDVKYSRGLAATRKPLPKCWSWRFRGTNKIEKGGIRDQGKCGGCWAFSIASALGDRYSLKYNIESPYPSSAWLISNAKPPQIASNVECLTGGNTYFAGKWLEQNIVKLEECWPYSVIRNHEYVSPMNLDALPNNCCFNCCDEFVKERSSIGFHCKPNSTKFIVDLDETQNQIDVNSTIRSIQHEIMTNGPVVSSFNVYKDFMDYWIKDAKDSNKIYIRKSNEAAGGHAVVLTGWGEIDGVKYWEVRNSWGLTGDHGYCKIAFSTHTPHDKWIQIDIPLFNGQNYTGGIVSFLPGELKNKKMFKEGIMFKELENQTDCDFNEKTIVKKPSIKTSKKLKVDNIDAEYKLVKSTISTRNIIIYISVTVMVLLIIFLIYKFAKKTYTNSNIKSNISLPIKTYQYYPVNYRTDILY